MKILKYGQIPRRTKQFTCKKCGTVFLADETEYRCADQLAVMHDGITAYCKCPVCGNEAYEEYQ